MMESMIPYWWWDALAFVGAACSIAVLVFITWLVLCEIQSRRMMNREMREFNEKIEAISRVWEPNRDR